MLVEVLDQLLFARRLVAGKHTYAQAQRQGNEGHKHVHDSLYADPKLTHLTFCRSSITSALAIILITVLTKRAPIIYSQSNPGPSGSVPLRPMRLKHQCRHKVLSLADPIGHPVGVRPEDERRRRTV